MKGYRYEDLVKPAASAFKSNDYKVALDKYFRYYNITMNYEFFDEKLKFMRYLESDIARCYSRLNDLENAIKFFSKSVYSMWGDMFINSNYDRELPMLYSFRTINKYFIEDLINKTITLTNPLKFNDPFDCPILSYSGCKYRWESFRKIKIRSFSCKTTILGECKEKSNDEEVNNMLMWSHYADSHKGLCVEYKFKKDFCKKNDRRDYCSLGDVLYSNEFPKGDNGSLNIEEGYLHKSEVWKYENEVRLLNYDPECNEDHKSISFGDGVTIEAIYFGCHCPETDKKLIKEILKSERVEFYEMHQDPQNRYNLKAIRIEEPKSTCKSL